MMSSQASAESRLKLLIRKLGNYVDELFDNILKIIDSRDQQLKEKEIAIERLTAIEELKDAIAIETLLYIARWQPLGRDLLKAERYIRTSYDLFRISRYLMEIKRLNEITGLAVKTSVNLEMLIKARKMVQMAIKSFLENDAQLSRTVQSMDQEIDEYYVNSIEKLRNISIDNKVAIEALFARHVERIADHATYISNITK
jgi:phosphate transport system protein